MRSNLPWRLVMLLPVFACLLVALALEVYVENREVSCSEQLKISIDKDCQNDFLTEDTVKARVKGNNAEVLKPFHFLSDENVMQVLDCVDFTHQIYCDVVGNQEREERIHYLVPPFRKQDGAPDAAVANQGFDICLLLILALLMVWFW